MGRRNVQNRAKTGRGSTPVRGNAGTEPNDRTPTREALELALANWQTTRADAEKARLALLSAIRKAAKAGTSQSEIARILGWPRQRVNEALR